MVGYALPIVWMFRLLGRQMGGPSVAVAGPVQSQLVVATEQSRGLASGKVHAYCKSMPAFVSSVFD